MHPLVRNVVSLLLCIHLFCVFVALAANSVSVSQLHSRLSGKLGLYTQSLNFEPSFSHDPSANVNDVVPYFLTYAREQDVDHRIEVLPEGKNPDDAGQWIVISAGGFHAGEDYKRQQRLARQLAFHGGNQANEAPSAALASGIARHFLVARGVRPQLVRSRDHSLMHWTFLSEGFPEQRDPWNEETYFRVPYTAQVLIGEDGKSVSVIKATPESESAGAGGAAGGNP